MLLTCFVSNVRVCHLDILATPRDKMSSADASELQAPTFVIYMNMYTSLKKTLFKIPVQLSHVYVLLIQPQS